MEFTSVDFFQHSPFGDILNSLRSLSLSGGSYPNYVRQDWDADDEEIRDPPTTHLVATVDDLTDMLDFDSEDIDGMDDDARDKEEPLPIGNWTSTSSHDVYMVDTPKENNDEERKDTTKGCPLEKQSKRQRKRRPKSHLNRNNDHTYPALEQGEPLLDHGNAENQTEQTNSVMDNSPEDITPDKRPEQQNAHQRLVATARSLKRQKQRLKAAQDTLQIRWSKVLNTAAKYGDNRPTKSYPKRKLLPEFDEEASDPPQPKIKTAT